MTGSWHILRRITAALLIVLTIAVAEAGRAPLLRPFTASYSLSRGYLEFARVEVQLTLFPDGRYEYHAHTQPVGLTAVLRNDEITETSHGQITEQGVRPDNYGYQHNGSEHPRHVQLHFDWQQMRVINRSSRSKWIMAIEPGTQDKFSQQLALMRAMAEGEREIGFPVADGGHLKQYLFSHQGEAELETPAGRFSTIHMLRSKQGRRSQASLWLAPALGYLPVRIERQEKDGRFLMELRSIRWHDRNDQP
jgi:hypothetical protein